MSIYVVISIIVCVFYLILKFTISSYHLIKFSFTCMCRYVTLCGIYEYCWGDRLGSKCSDIIHSRSWLERVISFLGNFSIDCYSCLVTTFKKTKGTTESQNK